MIKSSSSPRQTLGHLRSLFDKHNLRPKSKLGQNFLIDLNLLDLIVRTGELTRDDIVLEVGSGTGGLTTRLAQLAGAVLSVEIDPAFFALTSEATLGYPNVHLIRADVLKTKNEINPDVLAGLDDVLRRTKLDSPSAQFNLKLVANLPYAIATPLLANLLISGRPFERMVTTVQWEIAQRLTAKPRTKDYSALAVLVQSVADVHLIRRLASTVFWPRPQVESAIVLIRPNAAKRAHVGDVLRFRNFLRDLYTQRRKHLRSALAGWPRGRRDKAEVDRHLAELGIEGTRRAEELGIEDHLRLSRVFGEEGTSA